MSYIIHRQGQRNKMPGYYLSDSAPASYETLFALTIANSNWLKQNITAQTVIQKWTWSETFYVQWSALLPAILIVLYCICGFLYMGKVHRRSLLPLAPEPLMNSLAFLYQSTLVDKLEGIESPEKLSLDALHQKVEDLGHSYVLGRYRDDPDRGRHEQFGIDVPEEFDTFDQSDEIEEQDCPPRPEQEANDSAAAETTQ
ncbi:hypothetical protein QBC37DRAFT_35460 [Rhypophila decipiens]|uniref:Uncharacterized protein n=1 Tax=Rhypophila decipiens TaxID=261697 RepID=A0AAN6Y5C0_9PEZI|nr:hypothetical protein QBC37DRAFT_35460 [Rhypophila decipiens]